MVTKETTKLSTKKAANLVRDLQKNFGYNDTQIQDYFKKNNFEWERTPTKTVDTTPKTTVKLKSGAEYQLSSSELALRENNLKNQNIDPNTRIAEETGGVIQREIKSLDDAQTVDEVNQYFNNKQITEFENRNSNNEEENTNSIPTFEDYKKNYGKYLSSEDAPEVYSAADDLKNMREQYGIADLESKMNELNAQKAELEAQNRQRVQNQEGKAVPMGVITGRVSEIERQNNERMDAINREINNIANQYNTKMSVISQFMEANGQDYERAVQAYESEYKRNYDLLTMYRDDVKEYKKDMSDAEKLEYERMQDAKDDARATLQTMYNNVGSGTMDYESMSDSQKMLISKLEVQAGFPAGTIAQIKNQNPSSDIVTQSLVETADGKQMLNLVLRDKQTGEMTTKNINMGNASVDKSRYQYKDGGVIFDSATGETTRNIDTKVVTEAIQSSRKTGQCGEFVNDYLENLGLERAFGNDYETEKKPFINSSKASVGSIAIWQPSGATANPKYGHVGVVLEDRGDKVLIRDTNWKNDEQPFTHEVLKADIEKTGGYHVPPVSGTDTNAEEKMSEEQDKFYDDLDSYRSKVYDGEISIDQAISYFKSKYPGANDDHIAWLRQQLGE